MVTFRIGEYEKKIEFVLINNEHGRFTRNVKAIPGEFQHALVIVDIGKKKIRKVVKKTCTERKNISLLKDVKIRKRFEVKVIKLVDVGAQNLWGKLKDWVLEACDEVCGNEEGERSKGDMWWWNEEV